MDDPGDLGKQFGFLTLVLSATPPNPLPPVFLTGAFSVPRWGQPHFRGWGSPRPGWGWSQRLHVPEKSNCHSEGDCVLGRGDSAWISDIGPSPRPLPFRSTTAPWRKSLTTLKTGWMCFPCIEGKGVRMQMERKKCLGTWWASLRCVWGGNEVGTREHRWGCGRKILLPGPVCPPSTPGLLPHLPWIRSSVILWAPNLPGDPTEPAHQALGQSVCGKGEYPSARHTSSKGNIHETHRLKDLEEVSGIRAHLLHFQVGNLRHNGKRLPRVPKLTQGSTRL